MKEFLYSLRDSLISLKLTIALLVLGMVLVFTATLDQVNLGIWAVQEKYFRSFVIYSKFGPLALPIFPGGYTIGGLLLINVIGAYVYKFKFIWRKAGILLTHFGLIVLLVGELLTGLWQRDYFMRLDEGQTRNYAQSFRDHELAIIDVTDPTYDEVVAFPEKLLTGRRELKHAKLPFEIIPDSFFPNALLQVRPPETEGHRSSFPPSLATAGAGQHLLVSPQPITYKQDERNLPAAFLEIKAPDRSLGMWLVSTQLNVSQVFEYGGRSYQIALRPVRSYKPFSLTLLKFSHDRYAGTQIPKNFSSRLRLQTDDGTEDREVLVYMNNPLRHSGFTFYQSGFENNDRTTILQVVHNPSWLFPYVATVLMSVGLTLQFCIHLFTFVGRRRAMSAGKISAAPAAAGNRGTPSTPAPATV